MSYRNCIRWRWLSSFPFSADIVLDCMVLCYLLKKAWGREQILEGLKKITDGELQYKIPTEKLTGEQAEAWQITSII